MRILIAGGGTGGHIFPALAVARSLRALPDAPELRWLGGRRGLEGRIVPGAGIELRRLLLRSLRTVDLSIQAALDPLRLVASLPQALVELVRWRPDAIFTTGGYVAVPTLLAAAALRVPVLLWEGNVVPGRSVRATARLARVLAVSFPETAAALGREAYLTGTPIRDPAVGEAVAARARLGIPAGERCLLVFGGSQAARRLNHAVRQALPELADRAVVLHVTGEPAIGEFGAVRDALSQPGCDRYRPVAFLDREMADALAAADVIVGRAGSSTLAEMAARGVPMVIVPYPHAAGHQAANARVVGEAGAAIVIADEAFDGAALLAALDALGDRARYAAMAAASRSLGRPRAAAAVAALLAALARREPLPEPAAIERLARGAS
ncbi:MAG: hypothetical protein A2X23_06880 [Chloroflexi bacterium GWC2_73_18]|nr:MAG: hypothetical protein A2X23_06880 [Chloroflexi bacterium GWC2_73_18]